MIPILLFVSLLILVFLLWRRKDRQKVVKKFGIKSEEFALVQQDLHKGNHEAAEQRIAAAQEQNRSEIEAATGIDGRKLIPEIGNQISWADIVRHVFRVCEFDRGGTTIGQNYQVRVFACRITDL
jgi:hypothetical protein